MKTKHVKITNRPARKLPCILAASITGLLPAFALILTLASSQAGSATWNSDDGQDWIVPSNWMPTTVPHRPGDTATFDADFGDQTLVFIRPSDDGFMPLTIEVNGIVFNPGARLNPSFTIRVFSNAMLTISGVGIMNNSGTAQNFQVDSLGVINFKGIATAGSNVTITNSGSSVSGISGGATVFSGSSNAGNATVIAEGGVGVGSGSSISFQNTSHAANATLIASGGTDPDSGGTIFFQGMSTGDTARVEVFGNGKLDISGHTAGVTVGSIEGNGNVVLGANNLTVGSRNLPSTDFSGVISGLGGLTKVGSGTQTLSGENTYTGLTMVTAGTLAEGVSNAISTGGLTINGATAIFDLGANHSDSVGIVTLDGGGSITGTGTSTLTSTGSFEMKSGTVSAILGGSVALNKTTTGTVTLTGDNTYTGPTTVDAGSLLVDGSIGTGLTSVNAGGLLGGGGTIGGSVLNRGTVSPGHSPGTLTIDGDYTQTTGGTLQIEVAGLGPTEHDLLVVNGTATLAGTLKVIRLNGFHFLPGEQITLLTAGVALKGTFKPVENAFITGTIVESHIVYDRLSEPKSVILNLTQGSFADVCSTPNDIAVGTALDSAVGDPRAAGLIEFLDTVPLPELCDALDLIAPPDIASIFNIGVSLANIQTVNLERRLDDIRAGSRGFSASGFTINGSTPNFNGGLAGPTGPEGKSGPSVMQPTPENRWGVFVTGLGEFTNVGNTSNAHGFDLTTGGFTLGVDYRVCSNFAIGLTGGYAHTNADLANNGNLGVNGGTIGLYATAFGGGFYVDAAATGGFNNYDTDRTALLGTAHSSTDGADFTALLAGGYDWKIGGLSIGPVANFQYTYVSFDSFTESGSIAPLNFNSQNADSTRTSVGLKTSYDWKVGSVVVRPEIRAGWQHEFGDSEYSIVSRFANGAGSSFTVNGPAIGRDSLLIGAGAAVLLNDRVAIYAYYDGELARTNYSSNNVSAGVRVTF